MVVVLPDPPAGGGMLLLEVPRSDLLRRLLELNISLPRGDPVRLLPSAVDIGECYEGKK